MQQNGYNFIMREFDFYIVPTPIGNIQDITLRAIDVLKQVDIIACEDTRITQKLLNHYGIKTKCISCHKYNEQQRLEYFINELNNNKKIALVSDAGTPMICDPGNVIIKELLKNGYTVTALPGASAITTFLSQVPRENDEFVFFGFIPRSEKQINDVVTKNQYKNFVFYDSPERILKTLNIIKDVRGDIKIALGRELSKLFEEIKIAKISDMIKYYEKEIRGEIICMLYANEEIDNSNMQSYIIQLKEKGFKDKDISNILSTLFGYSKNDVYSFACKYTK